MLSQTSEKKIFENEVSYQSNYPKERQGLEGAAPVWLANDREATVIPYGQKLIEGHPAVVRESHSWECISQEVTCTGGKGLVTVEYLGRSYW